MIAERNGFTLIELLVALVISGILGAAIFQFLGGQARFAEMQSGREEVQQNARASIELISSELRSVPPLGYSIEGDGHEIRFKLPSAWGVICAYEPGTVWSRALFPALPSELVSDIRRLGFVHEDGDTSSASLSGNSERTSLGSCAALLPEGMDDSSLPPGYRVRRLQSENFAGMGKFLDGGTPIFLYRDVTYSVGPSSGLPGLWLLRRVGDANPEALAGPLHGGVEGFRVESVAGGLRLSIAMESRHRGSVQQTDRVSTKIYFRHYGGNE